MKTKVRLLEKKLTNVIIAICFMNIKKTYYKHKYIEHRDLSYFSDACNRVLEKKEKQAKSALCMIELWMTYMAFVSILVLLLK